MYENSVIGIKVRWGGDRWSLRKKREKKNEYNKKVTSISYKKKYIIKKTYINIDTSGNEGGDISSIGGEDGYGWTLTRGGVGLRCATILKRCPPLRMVNVAGGDGLGGAVNLTIPTHLL